MQRIMAFGFFALLIATPVGVGSPIEGMFSIEPELKEGVWTTVRAFRGGERAAVLVIGNAKEPFDVEISVFNANKDLVAFDKADGGPSGNVVGAIWYPPADGDYRIEVRHSAATQVYVAVK